jgi:hypothetical protein
MVALTCGSTICGKNDFVVIPNEVRDLLFLRLGASC